MFTDAYLNNNNNLKICSRFIACNFVCMYVCMYVLMYDYIYVLFVCRV